MLATSAGHVEQGARPRERPVGAQQLETSQQGCVVELRQLDACRLGALAQDVAQRVYRRRSCGAERQVAAPRRTSRSRCAPAPMRAARPSRPARGTRCRHAGRPADRGSRRSRRAAPGRGCGGRSQDRSTSAYRMLYRRCRRRAGARLLVLSVPRNPGPEPHVATVSNRGRRVARRVGTGCHELVGMAELLRMGAGAQRLRLVRRGERPAARRRTTGGDRRAARHPARERRAGTRRAGGARRRSPAATSPTAARRRDAHAGGRPAHVSSRGGEHRVPRPRGSRRAERAASRAIRPRARRGAAARPRRDRRAQPADRRRHDDGPRRDRTRFRRRPSAR